MKCSCVKDKWNMNEEKIENLRSNSDVVLKVLVTICLRFGFWSRELKNNERIRKGEWCKRGATWKTIGWEWGGW
jgi:hypothetical protein